MNNSLKPRHSDMMIKICGMSDIENIKEVSALSPMLMGFIFHKESIRNAEGIDPDAIKTLPDFIRPVAVTVDKPMDYLMNLHDTYGFRIFQLHGNESPDMCRELKDKGYVVIKAIGVDDSIDWNKYKDYVGNVDMFVFDTRTPMHGGSGSKFNWSVIATYNLDTPYLLSGGIGPDDIDAIISSMRPGMAGIDINSRFETSPGIKDISLLIKFILSLRKFNEYEPNRIPFWEKAE